MRCVKIICGAALFAVAQAVVFVNVAFGEEGTPGGLVVALSGSTAPPLAAMAEIPLGIPVQFAPGTELTFLHYGRCKLITISGGTLSVSRGGFITDGKIVGDKDGPCPRIYSVAGAVASGLLMRADDARLRWPLDPEILLAGASSSSVQAAAIYAEDKPDAPLVRLDVAGHKLRFPVGGQRPTANVRYILRLTLSGGTKPLDLPFVSAAPDGPQLIVILHQP